MQCRVSACGPGLIKVLFKPFALKCCWGWDLEIFTISSIDLWMKRLTGVWSQFPNMIFKIFQFLLCRIPFSVRKLSMENVSVGFFLLCQQFIVFVSVIHSQILFLPHFFASLSQCTVDQSFAHHDNYTIEISRQEWKLGVTL